jgi:hypothetical protein
MIKYKDWRNLIPENLRQEIIKIPQNLDSKNLYKGKGAEIMRNAVNNLIRLISTAELPVDREEIIYFFDVLIDNLKHPNNEIQMESCEGLRLLNETYSKQINESLMSEIEKKFLHVIKLAVSDESIYVTRGFTKSIPYFDSKLILGHYPEAMDCLYTNAKVKSLNNNDAETRKFAVESLCWLTVKFIEQYVRLFFNLAKINFRGFRKNSNLYFRRIK